MNIQASDGKDDMGEKGKQPERRMRRYQPHWQDAFSWVYYDEAVNKMFCKICQKNQDVSDPCSAYLFGGCCNFQIMSLQSHAKSKGHINAEDAERFKSGATTREQAWRLEPGSVGSVLPSSTSTASFNQFLSAQLCHMNNQTKGMPHIVSDGFMASPTSQNTRGPDASVVFAMGRPVTFQAGSRSSSKHPLSGLEPGVSARQLSWSVHTSPSTADIRPNSTLWNKFVNAHAVAKAGMSLKDFEWLCELDLVKGLNMDDDHTSKQCREILKVIARTETSKIRNAIDNCKFFSVVCDTFSGSHLDMIVIYVKCLCKGKQQLYMLDVLPIDPRKNETLLNVVSEALSRELGHNTWKRKLIGSVHSVDMVWCRPALDNANKMSDVVCAAVKLEPGVAHSVIASSSSEHPPVNILSDSLLSHQCLLHHIHESVMSTLQRLPYDRTVSDAIRAVRHCCQDVFVEEKGSCEPKSWSEDRLTDVNILMNNYSGIMASVNELEDERGTFDVCRALRFVKYIHFLSDVLEILVSTFRTLRDENTNIGVLYESISDTVDNIKKLQKRSGQQLCKVERETSFQGQHLDTSDTGAFDEDGDSVLKLLLDDLVPRICDLQEDTMAAMAKLACLSQWPVDSDDLKDYADEELLLVVGTYTGVMRNNGVDTNRCLMEWSQLKNHVRRRFSNPGSTSWKRIFPICQGKCENILCVISFILTLPGQTTEIEKGYLYLKETKWNAKLTADEVRDRLRIYHNTAAIGEFDPSPFLECWQEQLDPDGSPPKKMIRQISRDDDGDDDDDDDYAGNRCSFHIAPTL